MFAVPSHTTLGYPKPIWATIVLVVSLAGCIRATPTPEPVVISFAHPDFDTEAYQQWVEQFNERYPYITVELGPKKSEMLGGLSPGDADVFINSQFALNWLHGQGGILDLSPFIEQDASFDISGFYPGAVGLYTRDGKTWAIPVRVDIMVMYYNQDLFDQYDIPYPETGWTWDDFLNVTLTIRDPEANVFGYAPGNNLFDPLTFIYQHGGRIFDDLQNPTHTTFDDPLTIEALDWYIKLVYDYNVAPTPQQTQQAFGGRGLQAGIHQGKFGVWTGMLSERGGQRGPTEWTMRWGMVPLPRDAQSATLSVVEGYFVSSRTQHPDACWKWIAFLSQQMPNRQVPARKSVAQSAEYERQVGADVAAIARASMENALMLSPKLAGFEEALDIFGQAFEAITSERLTPEEAMTWAQQQSKFE